MKESTIFEDEAQTIYERDVSKALANTGITCPTCKGNFPSYPEFTAHIGSPTCANEIIVSPTEDSSREQS